MYSDMESSTAKTVYYYIQKKAWRNSTHAILKENSGQYLKEETTHNGILNRVYIPINLSFERDPDESKNSQGLGPTLCEISKLRNLKI